MCRETCADWCTVSEANIVILTREAVAPLRVKLCRGIGNAESDIENLRAFVKTANADGVSPGKRCSKDHSAPPA